MKTLIILACSLMLTACATPPAWLANAYNRSDPCQTQEFSKLDGARLKPQGYSAKDTPNWCSGGGQTYFVRVNNGPAQIITITK